MSRHLLLALGVLCSLGSARADDQEPVAVAGRSLAAWRKDLDADDLLVREEAIEVLATLGPKAKEALPALNKLLGHDDRTVRVRAALAVWKISGENKEIAAVLGDNLAKASPLARRDAVAAIGQLGAQAVTAVPGLVELIDDSDIPTRNNVQQALFRLDHLAFPALLAALKSKEPRLRRNAAAQLVAMQFSLGGDLGGLEAALKDDDAKVRMDVARILWGKGKADQAVLDGLAAGLAGGDEAMQLNILHAIFNSPQRPKALLPLLEKALKSSSVACKPIAARVLYQMEKKPDRVLPLYLELLQQKNSAAWHGVLPALGDLGEEAKPAVPRLVEMMKARDFYHLYELRQVMPRIGEPAIGPLVALLKDTATEAQYSVPQDQATFILAQMGTKAAEAVLPFLDDKQGRIRARAVRVLGAASPPPKGGVAKLTELLDDTEATVRTEAATALGNHGPDAEKAIPKLAELAAQKGDKPTRLAALRALMRVPAPAKVLTPLALEGLKANEADVRVVALEALETADPKHELLLDKVRELLKDDATRPGAIQLLGRMGEGAAKAVPDLIEQLENKNDFIRRTAVTVLTQLGPVAKQAGPALADLLTSPDQALQAAALAAIARIGPEPKGVVPKLIDFVKDPKNRRNYAMTNALNALEVFGPKAADAWPDLLALLKDESQTSYQRGQAGLVLVRIDADKAKKEALETLRAVSRGDPNNYMALRGVLLADPKDKDALARIEAGLKGANLSSKASALQAVSSMGAEGKPFADLLRPLLKERLYSTRAIAALALFRVSGDAKEALPVLQEMLEDRREPHARGYAAFVLGEMGAAAKPAWKVLVPLRRETDQYTRQQAEFALKKIDPAEAAKLGVR